MLAVHLVSLQLFRGLQIGFLQSEILATIARHDETGCSLNRLAGAYAIGWHSSWPVTWEPFQRLGGSLPLPEDAGRSDRRRLELPQCQSFLPGECRKAEHNGCSNDTSGNTEK